MRSAGRRLSGRSLVDLWCCRETTTTPLLQTEMATNKDSSAIGRCRSGPWAERSGILAFGNNVIGQPAHPDASRTFTTENWVSECSALSRSQIETHATKIHMKLIGSKAAINLLNGGVNIPNIIHSGFVLRHGVVTVPGCVSEKSIVLYVRPS
jgi:hypothetical protein